jgi:zinc transporter, ZIP family
LKRVGILTALSISLHNFPEGIAVYLACLKGLEVGFPIAIAIAAHNIPEGMAVASPIYHSTGSKWEALKWSLVSGMCEPIAAFIFGTLLSNYITDDMVQMLLAGGTPTCKRASILCLLISFPSFSRSCWYHGFG